MTSQLKSINSFKASMRSSLGNVSISSRPRNLSYSSQECLKSMYRTSKRILTTLDTTQLTKLLSGSGKLSQNTLRRTWLSWFSSSLELQRFPLKVFHTSWAWMVFNVFRFTVTLAITSFRSRTPASTSWIFRTTHQNKCWNRNWEYVWPGEVKASALCDMF